MLPPGPNGLSVPNRLQITAASPDPALLTLPWQVPLEDWPQDLLAALPRGISRHVVRFVKLSGRVIAIKEIGESVAFREYELLRQLERLRMPAVEPVGVVSRRQSPDGEPLTPALITEHLAFSLPYRALFSQYLRPDTATRLVDALAVLLVRLHLSGFYWGDVSLSNALFRRDAGAFAAYLVDAETSDLQPKLTNGQRAYDLEIARVNVIGELMDLEAGEILDDTVDAVTVGDALVVRYEELWQELTTSEWFEPGELWRVQARIDRLNDLGFDVDELDMSTDIDGTRIQIQPKVVDAGHHHRRLMRLTGLDVQENQARRLLNDLDSYRVATERQGEDEAFVAHDWLTNVFEPTIRAIPRELRGKLEPAEVFHELLEHRWYKSQEAQADLTLAQITPDYIEHVLAHRPDEQAIIGLDTATLRALDEDGDEPIEDDDDLILG